LIERVVAAGRLRYRRLTGLRRVARALAIAPALAGCATAANTLSPAEIASFKLTDMKVVFAPDARIVWEDGMTAFARANNVPADQMLNAAESETGKAVTQFDIVPTAQRLLIGSAANSMTADINTGGPRPASSFWPIQSSCRGAQVVAWWWSRQWSMRPSPARPTR